MSRIEDIRTRLAAATPGAWAVCACEVCEHDHRPAVMDASHVGVVAYVETDEAGTEADADLIAHAPQDLADLLAVVDEARNVLQAHDEAQEPDAEQDWTGPMVDLRLRAALARIDGDT